MINIVMRKTALPIALLFLGIILSCKEKNSSPTDKFAHDSSMPRVPDGFYVEVAAGPSLVDFPMFASVDEFGRLFVYESTGNVYDSTGDAIKNPQFRIKLLEDTTGDGIYDKATVYADKLSFPQGGVFYKGSLYATCSPDFIKLTDTNGDNIADKKEVLLTGFTLNVNANSLVGPVMAPDGWLYMNSAIMGFDVKTKEGTRLKGETARTWRLRPDGSKLEWISAGGMNNPVELTFTEASEPIGTETYFTDPLAGERDALVYWTEGGVYPKPNGNISRDKLVRTGELMPVVSKFSRVAPSGICRYRSTVFGDEYSNNLFSAQFNTHRILRHQLSRKGASFTTQDEIFFESKNEDFHPTDVLEDADGSLLIVETGGWFIEGCPLSQVSKPELKGSIYRVRKKNTEPVNDAYGKDLNWSSQQPDKLVAMLEDSRPFVNDKALIHIADAGDNAVSSLNNLLQRSTNASARTRAIFALYRIGTNQSVTTIRKYITDKHEDVSVAASRCVGLYKDLGSVPQLVSALQSPSSAARRQAATALGQIGSREAIQPLLSAAAGDSDRFVEHSIIYSLVQLNDAQQVRTGLAHTSQKVNKAALIALDQMQGSPVQVSDVSTLLTSPDQQLRQTALWVASHHPAWAPEMAGYIGDRLRQDSLAEDEKKTLSELIVAFASEPVIQKFIASNYSSLPEAQRLFVLDVLSQIRMKQFPPLWTTMLRNELKSNNSQQQTKALQLIQLHQLKSLSGDVGALARNSSNNPEVRLLAYSILASDKASIDAASFQFVYEQLNSGEAITKQHAANVLTGYNLNEQQLQHLAGHLSSNGDAYTLNKIAPAFKRGGSAKIGASLARTLASAPGLDGFSEQAVKELFAKYPADVTPAVDSLIQKLRIAQASRLERLKELESAIDSGNLDRGRVLFFGKATCGTCHTIGNQGGNLGPDLTSIQRDRSAHDLLEAIVYPSVSFVREFETYTVKTRNGNHRGIVRQRSPAGLQLLVAPESAIRIAAEDITSIELDQTSMMPQGFDKLLSRQEMADLMVFLVGQDQDPETDARILR
jgi:putative membrane-bound dehydrogenase-like protein